MRQRQNDEDASPDGMEELLALPVEPAEEYADWRPDWLKTEKAPEMRTRPSSHVGFSPEELRYLQAINDNPAQPSSAYAKLAKISSKKSISLRNRLEQLGYLRVTQIKTGPKGRPAILLEVTKKGLDALHGGISQ
jgi:hypothetical protein